MFSRATIQSSAPAETRRPKGGRHRVIQPITNRVRRDGKFFRLGADKFYVKGVTYGPFKPGQDGEPLPESRAGPPQISQQMLRSGRQLPSHLPSSARLVSRSRPGNGPEDFSRRRLAEEPHFRRRPRTHSSTPTTPSAKPPKPAAIIRPFSPSASSTKSPRTSSASSAATKSRNSSMTWSTSSRKKPRIAWLPSPISRPPNTSIRREHRLRLLQCLSAR